MSIKMKIIVIGYIFSLAASCAPKSKQLLGHIGRPSISPDGKQLAFIYAEDAASDVWEVYTADVNGENVNRLTNFKQARIKKGPVWSPDGNRIAFHADINEGAQLFSINKNGEDLVQLTALPGHNVEPYWSPTGEELIFNAVPKDGKVKMMVMDKDGSNVRPLYNPDGHNWYPRIVHKDKVVFTSDINHEHFYDIFSMNLDGSNLQQLTSVKAINWFPEYSPDGEKIVFHSNQDDPSFSDAGDYNLYMINADGSGMTRLTNLKGQELHAKWFPSGDKLIFEWHDEVAKGLHILNIDTGEISKVNFTY